jgi:hypothetical protein
LNNNIKINRSNFFEIGNHNILHLIDEFSKNIDVKARNDYKNKNIVDGLNTLKNLNYKYNDDVQMLDIISFSCLYDSNQKLEQTSLFVKSRPKKIPHPIGKFAFYNFN